MSDVTVAQKTRRFGAWYVAEHKIREVRAFFWTMLATALGTPFLYLFTFGVGLATLLVDGSGGGAFIDGVSYLQFVAPALVINAAVLVASEEYQFGILMGFKWNETFFAMNATPLTGRQIIDGMFLYIALRAFVTASLYFAVVLLFGATVSPASVVGVLVAVLTALAFSPVAAYAATIRDDRGQFNIVNRLIITPLTLFSGTVFPLTQLPVFLQWIGWVSPIWHGSELARQFSYGPTEPIWLTVIHFAYLAALAIIGWQLTARLAIRRLDR